MSVEDELRQYVQPATDNAVNPKEDPAIASRVEELLSELKLSWSVDDQGDWVVESDEGEISLLLGGETLSVLQYLRRIEEKPKKLGVYFESLLSLNASDNNSAAFFLVAIPGGGEARMLGIKSEISVLNLDKSELALSLKSVLELSHLWSLHLAA